MVKRTNGEGEIHSNVPGLRRMRRCNRSRGLVLLPREISKINRMCSERRDYVKKFKKMVKDCPAPHRLKMLLDVPPAPREKQLKYGWNAKYCCQPSFVKEDQFTFCRRPAPYSTHRVRGKIGFTKGLHVWEICWPTDRRGTNATVGVATAEASLHWPGYDHHCLLGFTKEAWGWDLSTSRLHHNSGFMSGTKYPTFLRPGQRFRVPQKFLVVLDMDVGTLSFVVDGQYLGVAFTGLKGKKLYPIVSAVRSCEITMKYIGGLHPRPPTLKDLCRPVIRKRLGREDLDEKVASLAIPKTLKPFLLYRNHK